MARRGLFHYLRIQWRDGLFRFLLDAPTAVDLERVVVVPGPRVAFAQTDYNRHFTVREIVRDSERGFYNLVHASGLAHLEHYFRVMFFASRLEARFDAELLEGEAYEMRCRVAEITGPLVDVEVAFHSLRGGRDDKDAAAFRVVWRLMLVVDPRRRATSKNPISQSSQMAAMASSASTTPSGSSPPSAKASRASKVSSRALRPAQDASFRSPSRPSIETIDAMSAASSLVSGASSPSIADPVAGIGGHLTETPRRRAGSSGPCPAVSVRLDLPPV